VALQVTTRGPSVQATLKSRESLSQLGDDRLAAFREALAGMMDRPDNRGYQFFAGWHGVPDGICEHHNDRFLPWHRGYLYHFELALQDIDDSVTLPWWNWLEEPGLPDAYAEPEVNGQPNVLYSAPVQPMGVPREDWWPEQTHREPFDGGGPGPFAPPLRQFQVADQWVDTWEWLMGSPSYTQFERRCWAVHDHVHGWVGGEMGDPNWAAFDPLFWAHHTMVDRLWRIWQHNNPGALPPAEILDEPMTFNRPPSFTPRDVLDVKQLGYEYAGQTASTSASGTG
jgi:tyrosinase